MDRQGREGLDSFWAASAEDALRGLGATPAGLSQEEAARRFAVCGPNRVRERRGAAWAPLLARQFLSPLVLLLVVAAFLSLVVGSFVDATIVLVIVVLSGFLGFWQEYVAQNAVAKLLALIAVKATVLRDGASASLPFEDVVPGDVLLLSAGSLVPADARLLEAKDLYVDEASLTGESFPAEKAPEPAPSDAPLAARRSAVFSGTHVVSGAARAVVVRTGARTELGRLASRLRARRPATDFEVGVQRFGFLLLQVTVVLVIIVLAANVYAGRPALQSVLFALALAVGLVPELLPVIVAVNLAHGARRMAHGRVIVKRLGALVEFGSMDVLCSDKTGTITESELEVHSAVSGDGRPSEGVLRYAVINARCESGFGNPIDAALRAQPVDLSGVEKLDEVPFDFTRKRLSVLVRSGGETLLVTKGAVDRVMAVCSSARTAGGPAPMREARAGVAEQFAALSKLGLRTLGVATRRMPDATRANHDAERDMTFEGFIAFSAPPKAGVEADLRALRNLGVRVKIVTGDNRQVAGAVAGQVGIAGLRVVSGPEVARLRPEALQRVVADRDVFAEIEPGQKEQIVLALRRAGHTVGYLGDGINDTAALHAADVGISVNNAVDVAKEAADIVLMERSLSVIAEGVREGRRTFANTLKYVYITASANFGNMLSVAGAAVFLPFLPLLPTQILLNNFLSDLPAMTIAADRVDPEATQQPVHWDIHFIRDFALVFGAISTAFDFLTFSVLLALGATVGQFRTAWFLESVTTELLVLLVMRTARPMWRSSPALSLLLVTTVVFVASLLLVYVPAGRLFEFEPPSVAYLAVLAAITAGYLVASELGKAWFFRRLSFGRSTGGRFSQGGPAGILLP